MPAQRTVYMLCVVAAAVWLGAVESSSVVLAAALLIVLLLDPWAVLAPGFWLSFGAVGVIMFVCNGRIGRPHWLATWVRVQFAVTLAMVPVLLAVFQQVSVVSPVANALAIPAVGLGVVPLTLLGMALPFDWVLQLAHELMSWCTWCLEWLSAISTRRCGSSARRRRGRSWRRSAASCSCSRRAGCPGAGWVPPAWFRSSSAVPSALEPGALQVTVLDVGQGVATVVRTANHALLYDAGPAFGPQADSGNRVIVPFLRAAGVTRLDAHDREPRPRRPQRRGGLGDAGGAGRLACSPRCPISIRCCCRRTTTLRCLAGQRWEWDGVRFEIVHPALARLRRSRRCATTTATACS